MTDRRTFIGAVTLGVLIAPLGALVQRVQKMYRIGWLGGTSPLDEHWKVFNEGMRERGWIEGQNFTYERLYSDGRSERFPGLAAELVQRKVDLIITAGTPPTAAAKGATSTIPVVFWAVG
jgi:putative tryptophan/tyrosine transport system substrate-binding protein